MKLIALSGVAGSGKDTFYRFLAAYNHAAVRYKFAHPLQDAVALLGGFYSRNGSHRLWFEDRDWKSYCIIDLSAVHQNAGYRREVFEKIAALICNATSEQPWEQARLALPKRELSGGELYEALERWFDKCLPKNHYSPREIQQLFGSNLCRHHIDEDLWVAHMNSRLLKAEVTTLAVITDLRFPNELTLVQQWHGKVIYLESKKAWEEAKANRVLAHESESYYEYIKSKADLVYRNDGSLTELKEFTEGVHQQWFGW